MTLRFSANLGFLWTQMPPAEAVRAAARAGFDAIELHWPEANQIAPIRDALAETGLPVLGLNTERGDVPAGEFGLSALPGREDEARAAIDRAIGSARAIGARAVHVMAGRAKGRKARHTFIENLRYAADQAAPAGISILIEPLNPTDLPGYFLASNADAAEIIADTGQNSVRIMFDCYHVRMQGRPILAEFEAHRDLVGHVQFASVPDRAEPDAGEVKYAALMPELKRRGYRGFFGAEYKPRRSTEEGLGWLADWHDLRAG